MKYKFEDVDMFKEGITWSKNTPVNILRYAVGALLYAPVFHDKLGEYICCRKNENVKSISICLEDAIADDNLQGAEDALYSILKDVYSCVSDGRLAVDELPLIFVRFRTPEQLHSVYRRINYFREILTGFSMPKFDMSNGERYCDIISDINGNSGSQALYMMPILESAKLLDIEKRASELMSISSMLSGVKDYVLNVRVGGNDLMGRLGLRRRITDTIYDIRAVSNALADVINVFGTDYVVSGPVWEYFGGSGENCWQEGLEREIDMDMLNGFIGKTAVHPTQVPVIQRKYAVSYADYLDAESILKWNDNVLSVNRSPMNYRMNELKVHWRWAEKIMMLADIYGVKNEG